MIYCNDNSILQIIIIGLLVSGPTWTSQVISKLLKLDPNKYSHVQERGHLYNIHGSINGKNKLKIDFFFTAILEHAFRMPTN